ncbi:hypothetical protein G6F32_017486 [Rhizopus arrhizus]|nr:hypothetical protein G6F32_017486 [Rhizopus arrhizus]
MEDGGQHPVAGRAHAQTGRLAAAGHRAGRRRGPPGRPVGGRGAGGGGWCAGGCTRRPGPAAGAVSPR